MNGIVREKFPVLLRELGGKCFVVRDNQGRFADFFYHIGGGESLAGTGYTQKRLIPQTRSYPVDELLNGFRLYARRLECAINLKNSH